MLRDFTISAALVVHSGGSAVSNNRSRIDLIEDYFATVALKDLQFPRALFGKASPRTEVLESSH